MPVALGIPERTNRTKMTKIIAVCFLLLCIAVSSCKTTRQINKAIAPKDTTNVMARHNAEDSIKAVNATLEKFKSHHIDFQTFSAKIKVEVSDKNGKQPDITAVVRIIKDSAIWMSLSATFLNIEVYRVLITRDSVILLNKQAKEVQYRSLDYLQEVTEIPFDFETVQQLLIGNPIFYTDSIISYKQDDRFVLLTTIGTHFKNLITLSLDEKLLLHSKMDDVNTSRSRTADITYNDHQNRNGVFFAAKRHITASEKNKIDIDLDFKQYEFNKELSVGLTVPKNYKRK